MNDIDNKSNALSKKIAGFLVAFAVATLIFEILIYGYGAYRQFDFVTVGWAFQKAILMGAAVGIGWVIGSMSGALQKKSKFWAFMTVVGVGILLVLVFLYIYFHYFAF